MIAIVGLGNMGLAMGRRVAERGHRTFGVDVSAERRVLWTRETGMPAGTEVPADADRVLVVVRLTEQAVEVLETLHDVDCYLMTTLDVKTARRLGEYARPDLRIIESPVSGGEAAAANGTLTVLTAGDTDTAFLTGTIAKHLVPFERYGDPTLAKLFNNVTGAYNALALARMLELADEAGLDPARLHEVLLTSSGGSWMTAAFADLRDDLLAKDVGLLASVLTLPEIRPDVDLPAVLGRARQRFLSG